MACQSILVKIEDKRPRYDVFNVVQPPSKQLVHVLDACIDLPDQSLTVTLAG